MRKILLAAGVMASLAMSIGQPVPSEAQTIRLGGSDSAMLNLLQRNGYSNIVITKRGFTISNAEACRNGEKFLVKVSILGEIRSAVKIGNCGNRFGPQQAVKYLQDEGYKDIDAKADGRRVVATACRGNRKFEIAFNLRGDVINRDRLGRCRNAGPVKTVAEIRRDLRRQGYDRIKFTDDQLPRYVAEACNHNAKMEIVLNRRGQIRNERRIGDCRLALDPATLGTLLKDDGLNRVRIVQDRRAPYTARGCRNNDRVEVIVNRWGDIRSETKIGECQKPLKAADLSAFLGKEGYDRVNVLRGRRLPYLVEACKGRSLIELEIGRYGRIESSTRVGRCRPPKTKDDIVQLMQDKKHFLITVTQRANGSFSAEGCKDEDKVRVIYSRFGEERRSSKIGVCKSETVLDVVNTLESRGAENTRVIIEGCFRNKKYHWVYDRLGNRVGREAAGGGC